MNNIIKESGKKALSVMLSIIIMLSVCMPAFAVEEAESEALLGTVTAFTQGIDVTGTDEIVATNTEEINLEFEKADESIGRLQDGWWAGIKVVAPAKLTEDELKSVKYSKLTDGEWVDGSFWEVKDSAEGDAVHYVGVWAYVTPELIAKAENGFITYEYRFDWDGDGFDYTAQTVTIKLDVSKINLDMSRFTGSVEAFTPGLTAEGTDKVIVTNTEEINLDFEKADESIGRLKDGWWAGIKVIAPAKLTEEELKTAKFSKLTDGEWVDGSFWEVKDSAEGDAVHHVGVWAYVTPELIAEAENGFITYEYKFDWDGNGFETSTQYVTIKLDVSKINLEKSFFTGSVEAFTSGLTAEGTDKVIVTNTEEINLNFERADESIGRLKDGWWAGIKVIAPAKLTEEELKSAKFSKLTDGEWVDGSFWEVKDSAEGDAVHYVGVWAYVTPELIAKAENGFITYEYKFDWDGNGFETSTQYVTIKLDVSKINLEKSFFTGSVEAFTSGLTAEGTDKVIVTNTEEINLNFERADESIGRLKDGWWAGIKVIAPAKLTEEELKAAKFSKLTDGEWVDGSFWDVKDSKAGDAVHYVGVWAYVTPELIAKAENGFITYEYRFDWDGNGFETSTQYVTIKLDVSKINLDMSHFTGSVEAFTTGLTATADASGNITVTNEEEVALDFAFADESIGRLQDGWWAGIKVIAPAELTEDELKSAKYSKLTDGKWVDGSFWDVKDSAEGDAEHYVGVWAYVTPELIAKAENGFITYEYRFDWDGDGFDYTAQTVTVKLDVSKIKLDMSRFTGSVEAFTTGLTATADASGNITVTNEEEVALDFAFADDSIGRLQDGWWAGIKVLAPAELTEDELKSAKYSKLTDGKWVDGSFWEVKDSAEGDAVHYVGVWAYVTPELIAKAENDFITYEYRFDWDGNGFDYTAQTVTVKLDVSKINLDMSRFTGSVEAFTTGLTATADSSGNITVTNEEEVALDFAFADDSIGRLQDGWWAGIKVVAPAELTEDELKSAKYSKLTDGEWVDGSFWEVKDSKAGDAVHYVGVWAYVTPELIAKAENGFITYEYRFDWDGDGFDYTAQKVTIKLAVDKIKLNYEDNFASVEGITGSLDVAGNGTGNVKVTNGEEITLDFSLADMSVGRYMDAWWVGLKVFAPEGMTEAELKNAYYRVPEGDSWSARRSFWKNKDSAEGADRHFITLWLPVTTEYIENDEDGIFNWTYQFDWDGNGFDVSSQLLKISIDSEKLNLIHSAGCTKVIDIAAKEPGCFENGNTEQSHCSVCGLITGYYEVIPTFGGHNFTEKIMDEEHLASAADCVYYDRYYYSCSRCDVMSEDTYEDKEGSVLLAHEKCRKIDKIHLISPADCENPAKYYMGCKNCDTVFTKDKPFTDGEPKFHLFTVEKVTTKAGMGVKGYTNFYCEVCGARDNQKIPFAAISKATLNKTTLNYTGKGLTPAVTVKDTAGKTLKKGTDYKVTYSNNVAPGTATAKITFTGKYTGTYTIKFKIVIPATSKIIFTSTTSSVKLTWAKVTGATSYKVYQKTSKGWKVVAETSKNTATIKKLSAAKKYSFAVKAVAKTGGKTYLASAYKSIYTSTCTAATSKLVASQTTSAIKLTWKAVKGAAGYVVQQKTSSGGWKTVASTKKTSVTIKKLKSGTNYIYAVKAVVYTGDSKKVYSEAKQLITATKPASTKIAAASAGGKLQVKWNKVSGASGYQILYKEEGQKSFKVLGKVASSKKSFIKSGFVPGTKYVIAVRAYKAVQNGYVYGAATQTTITIK